jgi:membrane associated rhomboid family serine protease
MQRRAFYSIYFPLVAICVMWLLKVVESVLEIDLKTFGIFPRKLEGIKGIVTSPFIHGDFNHLLSNTMPFFLLASAIFYFYPKLAPRIIILSWLLSGLALWLGGRYAWHIGASGLVYAFASFLFFSGILSKERHLIAISLLVIFLYGGLIWGIFPGKVQVSWEAHLFGFIAGFVLAFYMGKMKTPIALVDEKLSDDFSETDYTHKEHFNIHYHFTYNDRYQDSINNKE